LIFNPFKDGLVGIEKKPLPGEYNSGVKNSQKKHNWGKN
jgi:hypothetical protein